ncbi:hypothetical protein QCA50_018850 [Cerrena zonata]|uniref:DUF676 domain-containing protein n=1 Tax=Cerrena zonata TaxID=2478898 RepID=A0AAW0FDK0_9APHY
MAGRIGRLKDDVDDRVKGDAYDRLKDDGENRPKGDGEVKSAHLFVLVHGLWGGPNHMSTIERAILDGLSTVTNDKIVTLKPSSFRFWKTYDGIQVNAERVMTDILYEIETLKEKQNYHVNKISIIGYSLGGLISRYVIGKFYEHDEISDDDFKVYQGGPIDEDDFKAGQARRDQRDRLSQHESFKGDTSELTENTMENILYAEERFTGKLSDVNPDDDDFDRGRDYESSEGSGNELNESTPKPTAISTSINTSKPTEVKPTLLNVITGKHKKKILDINQDLNDKLAATHLAHLKNINYNEYPLFNRDTKLQEEAKELLQKGPPQSIFGSPS